MILNLETAAPSKECGLKPQVGEVVIDVNGREYQAVKQKAKKRCTCEGCDLNRRQDGYALCVCRHLVCAWIYRPDKKDVIFKRIR